MRGGAPPAFFIRRSFAGNSSFFYRKFSLFRAFGVLYLRIENSICPAPRGRIRTEVNHHMEKKSFVLHIRPQMPDPPDIDDLIFGEDKEHSEK